MAESVPITAAMLYDLVHCPHRVTMDLYADVGERVPVSPFVQLLWEKGALYEKEVIAGLEVPFVDLSGVSGEEKARLTMEALRRGEPLVYAGRIAADDLLGEPDLLRREDGGYAPIDIKSGAGEAGPEDVRRPKVHYGVQLALYVDILERLGLSAGKRCYIWDVHGEEVPYDLAAPKGPRSPETLWDDYRRALDTARTIVRTGGGTTPAYAGVCKLCPWYAVCLDDMQKAGDLTLIPELGRSTRDRMKERCPTIRGLADSDPDDLIEGGKTAFPGLGPDRLRRFHARAKLLAGGGRAYRRGSVALPHADRELFFDVEYDPFRDVCYLHGFIERRGRDGATERFVAFFAEDPTPESEERAFREAVAYMQASQPCAIYYYSRYERTVYRKLRQRYPRVVDEEALEALFDPERSVDLYSDVVVKATEWPTRDFSIKTLAKHLGFAWRDTDPSGAASIEWFHRWVESRDPVVRQRILDYNEDDCRATRVLRDAVERLPLVEPDAG